MKARYFTYGQNSKPVFYLTDLKANLYPNHNSEEFYNEIDTNWLNKPNVIIIDDTDSTQLGTQVEMFNIEKYLNKLEELKKKLDEEDDD